MTKVKLEVAQNETLDGFSVGERFPRYMLAKRESFLIRESEEEAEDEAQWPEDPSLIVLCSSEGFFFFFSRNN